MAKNITCTDCVKKIDTEAQKNYIVVNNEVQEFNAESYMEIEQHCSTCVECEQHMRSQGI